MRTISGAAGILSPIFLSGVQKRVVPKYLSYSKTCRCDVKAHFFQPVTKKPSVSSVACRLLGNTVGIENGFCAVHNVWDIQFQEDTHYEKN